jgi:hypothetical protein
MSIWTARAGGRPMLASPCHAEERRLRSGRSDPERRRRESRFGAGTARRSGASNRSGKRTRINTGCAHRFLSVPVRGIGVIGVIRVQHGALSGQHGIPAGLASPPAAACSEGQVGQREGQPHTPGKGPQATLSRPKFGPSRPIRRLPSSDR